MKREELIAYDKWLTRRKWGTGEIISPEKAADLYLAEHPFPPAEGAEEILDKYPHSTEYPSFIHENSAIAAMTEFATLHAQKIADKMVEKRLREQKAFTDWCINHVEIESREEKYIIDNETTIYSFSDLLDYWNRYLKSRDSHETI